MNNNMVLSFHFKYWFKFLYLYFS